MFPGCVEVENLGGILLFQLRSKNVIRDVVGILGARTLGTLSRAGGALDSCRW